METSSSRGGGDVASTSRGREDVASTSRGGGDVAISSTGGRNVASLSRGRGDVASSSSTAEERPMFWTRDLDRHYLGNFSTAVIQANINLEDYSQVEVGNRSTFVGVYDGHGGHQAAEHVRRTFTKYVTEYVTCTPIMSEDVLRHAFARTEESWLGIVNTRFGRDACVAARGTCCLVGVIWRGNLYVANVGDSRAILGSEVEGSQEILVHQLTRDDNVRDPVVRAEVLGEHPDEPDFIVEDETANGVYRIKGRIQVSKSIGDAYLKIPRFNLDLLDPRFVLNTPVLKDRPALSAEPITSTILIEPQHRFVIFASDGLWDLMSNQEVADFVQQNPKEGIAGRLVTHALTQRRKIHDDISVVVIFFDHTLQLESEIQEEFPKYSIREGSVSSERGSYFTALDDIFLSPSMDRTVLIDNLPYQTTFSTVYKKFKKFGPIEKLFLDRHGFSGKIRFYEPHAAFGCIAAYQSILIIKGKLVSVSYPWEKRYRLQFKTVDYICDVDEQHMTTYIGNLSDNETVDEMRKLFIEHEFILANEPVIQVVQKEGRNNEKLYAFVTFRSKEDFDRALDMNGMMHLGKPLNIERRRLKILQGDMKKEFDIISERLKSLQG